MLKLETYPSTIAFMKFSMSLNLDNNKFLLEIGRYNKERNLEKLKRNSEIPTNLNK
jgi:hypothetical protein